MKKNRPEDKAMLPVLIAPLRRCGSHALRLRLNFSPEFYSPYPLHLVDFMPLIPLYGNLEDDSRYFQLVTDLTGLLTSSLVKWEGVSIEPIRLFERIKNKPRNVHTITWEILFEAAKTHHAHVVTDKSLDSIYYWKELLSLYPKMLFINLVRDPRAQVSSMNRSIIHEFDSLLNAKIWMHAHEVIQELIKVHPQKVLTIHYEELMKNEEATLRKTCHFLGIDFLPEMLEIAQSAEANQISVQSTLWESNSSPPIQENLDKFKNHLSPNEIETIETLTGSFMDSYGYSRITPGKSNITSRSWEEARIKSDENKKKAWDKLQISNPKDYILRTRRADYIEMCRKNLLKKN